MKKLLSILAGLAITASASSTVVACGDINPTSQNARQGESTNGGFTPNSGNSNAGQGIPSGHQNPTETKQQRQQREIAQAQADVTPIAQKSILQDLYGISSNEKHIANLASGKNINVSKSMKTDGLEGSESPLMGYLGSLKGSDGKQLIPDIVNQIINLVLPSIKSNGIPNPSDLGSMLSSVLGLVPSSLLNGLYGTIDGKNSGVSSLEKTLDNKVFSDKIVKTINEVLEHGTVLGKGELSKYASMSLGGSLKAIAIGGAYLLAIATDDNESASKFADMTQVFESPIIEGGIKPDGEESDLSQNATEYIAQRLSGILTKGKDNKPEVKIDVTALVQNILSNKTTIDNISDMVQLFTLYITSFHDYQWTDADYAASKVSEIQDFVKDGAGMSNDTAIKEVRDKTIGELAADDKTVFDPLRLLSDLTYYLGNLDQKSGVYRIQALLQILFEDDDKSGSDFDITLDNSAKDAQVSANATPLSQIIINFVNDMMDTLKGKLDKIYDKKINSTVGGLIRAATLWKIDTPKTVGDLITDFGFSEESLLSALGRNAYTLIQSLTWNRGIKVSGALQIIDNGSTTIPTASALIWLLGFNGLQNWSFWKDIKNGGLLKAVYDNDNIWATLHSLQTGPLKSALDKLNSFGLNIDLNNMIDSALEPILGPVSDLDGNDITKEAIGLSSSLSDIGEAGGRTLTIEKNGKQTVLGTAPYVDPSKALTTDVGQLTYTAHAPSKTWDYSKPTIDNVVAGPDVDGTTTIYVYAENIYNGEKSGVQYGLGDENYDEDATTQNFINNLVIKDADGNEISTDNGNVISTSNVTKDDGIQNVLGSVTVDSSDVDKITSVSGSSDWYVGYYADHHYGWFGIKDGDNSTEIYKKVTDTFSFDCINRPVVKDELGLANYNDEFKDLYAGTLADNALADMSLVYMPVNGKDEFYADKENVSAYIDGDKSTNVVSWTQASADSLTLSRQGLLDHSISWLLQLFAVPGFDQQDGFLGMPLASDIFNVHMAKAISEVGKLLGDTDPAKYGIDISQYKELISLIIGTGKKDNIVDRVLNALDPNSKDGGNITSRLENVLGMVSSGMYSKNGLIGALIATFQPSLDTDSNSQYIIGYSGAETTPIWNKLTDMKPGGMLYDIWSELNTSYISDDQWNAISNLSNFDGLSKTDKPKIMAANAKGDVTGLRWDVTYNYSYYMHYKKQVKVNGEDVSTDVYKKVDVKGTYTIIVDGAGSDATYTVTKTSK